MSEIGWVLLALMGIVGINVAVTAIIVRAVYRRIRRNPALNSAALRTRARLSRGHHHEVLRLRVRLHESITSGRAAVDLVAQSGVAHGEVAQLFRRIEGEAVVLEAQLRLLESENDAVVLAEELTITRDRVDQVRDLVRHLRSAVASEIAGLSEDMFSALRADVHREVKALQAGMHELHSLHDHGLRSERTGNQQITPHQTTSRSVHEGNH